jgi:hypothetical protein
MPARSRKNAFYRTRRGGTDVDTVHAGRRSYGR